MYSHTTTSLTTLVVQLHSPTPEINFRILAMLQMRNVYSKMYHFLAVGIFLNTGHENYFGLPYFNILIIHSEYECVIK